MVIYVKMLEYECWRLKRNSGVVKTFYKNHVNIDFDLLAEKKKLFFFVFLLLLVKANQDYFEDRRCKSML